MKTVLSVGCKILSLGPQISWVQQSSTKYFLLYTCWTWEVVICSCFLQVGDIRKGINPSSTHQLIFTGHLVGTAAKIGLVAGLIAITVRRAIFSFFFPNFKVFSFVSCDHMYIPSGRCWQPNWINYAAFHGTISVWDWSLENVLLMGKYIRKELPLDELLQHWKAITLTVTRNLLHLASWTWLVLSLHATPQQVCTRNYWSSCSEWKRFQDCLWINMILAVSETLQKWIWAVCDGWILIDLQISGGKNSPGSFSRSAVNFNAGAYTTVSNIVMALVVMVVLKALTPLFKYTPNTILASVIIAAVISLIIPRQMWLEKRGNHLPHAMIYIYEIAEKTPQSHVWR